MNNKKSNQKDIFYLNIKDNDALFQQAQDVQQVMKLVYDKDKQKPRSSNSKSRIQHKDQSPNSNKHKKEVHEQIQAHNKPGEADHVNHQNSKLKGFIYQADQKINLGEDSAQIDHLSLSKDIIRFNGPLIQLAQQKDEEIKRATLKIQKIWKAKYRTIKNIEKEQLIQKNANNIHPNEFTFLQKKINSNDSPDKNNMEIKQEISPIKSEIKKSPNQKKNNQSPQKIQKASPQISSPDQQLKKGYLQKYQQKKGQDSQSDIQQDKIQKEVQQVVLKKDKVQNRDENKHQNQQQNIVAQQIEKQPQQQSQIQQQQVSKDQKKIIVANGGFKKPLVSKIQSEEKMKKAEKPYEEQNIIINNKQNQLEKRYHDKETVVQMIQQNQVINLQRKAQYEQNNQDKNHQKDKIQANPQSKQLPINIDLKKALIAQIINKQIQQQNHQDSNQDDHSHQARPKSSRLDKDPQKWEQKDKEVLKKLIEVYGKDSWEELAHHFPNKTAEQCKKMYEKLNSL